MIDPGILLAFVPQFVDPAHPLLPHVLVFGAVLALGGFVVNGLSGNVRVEWALRLVTASVFGALAVRQSIEGQRG